MDGVYAGNAGAISSPAKPEYMPFCAWTHLCRDDRESLNDPWHKTQLWVIWELPEGRAAISELTLTLAGISFGVR